MPFTISHAAAVLPLHARGRTRLPLAALMIGSMSPDFPYFTPWGLYLNAHNFPALFWFCWPVGLAVWILFVRVVETPTLALLPDEWRARFTPSDQRFTASLLMRASVAVILGAATHVIWDSFTHAGTPVTKAAPFLRIVVFEIGSHRVPLFNLLQHLSTLFGLAVLSLWAWRLKPHAAIRPSPVSSFARVGALVAAVHDIMHLGVRECGAAYNSSRRNGAVPSSHRRHDGLGAGVDHSGVVHEPETTGHRLKTDKRQC